MKHNTHTFVSVFSVLLLIGLPLMALGQNEKKGDLVGHWTFEKGRTLTDLTGNFGQIELKGARVKDGQLHISEGKWALTTGYAGPTIGPNKTLVAWVYLDNLDSVAGAPLSVSMSSDAMYDAIVYAQREPGRWMAGSTYGIRTMNAVPGFEEKETSKLIQLAISYKNVNGDAQIVIYRNGERIGAYTFGAIAKWVAGDVEALFGPRVVFQGETYGWIEARVEDARVYNAVLSQDEINNLVENTLDVAANGKFTTTWGEIKTRL